MLVVPSLVSATFFVVVVNKDKRIDTSDRFTDNSDGTVTDNRTGLIWLKKATCGEKKLWQGAMDFAAALHDGWTDDGKGGDCGLADGSSAGDWRLPTRTELESLMDYNYIEPSLSNAAGNGHWTEGDAFSGVLVDYYWTSDSRADSNNLDAWYLQLQYGYVGSEPKADSNYPKYYWPVRSKNTGIRFTDNSDGTVTDNLTGLIWLKKATCGEKKLWQGAMDFAAALHDGWTGDGKGDDCGLADGSSAGDWRLPTRTELRGLVDYNYTEPSLSNAAGDGHWTEGDAFSGVLVDYYWTSDSRAGSNNLDAWYLQFQYGYVGSDPKTDYQNYYWPVRSKK
ncbi:MAG: DUF1566 domain-containing protein [Candidatus Electrothrix gigas]